MSQLEDNTAHINNVFGAHNVGAMIGVLGVQYSGSCGVNVFSTSSTHAPPVDNYTSVVFSVAHTALSYSS